MDKPIAIVDAPKEQESPFSLWLLKATLHIREADDVKTQSVILRHVGNSPQSALNRFYETLSVRHGIAFVYRVDVLSIEWSAEVDTWVRG